MENAKEVDLQMCHGVLMRYMSIFLIYFDVMDIYTFDCPRKGKIWQESIAIYFAHIYGFTQLRNFLCFWAQKHNQNIISLYMTNPYF